MGWGRRKGTEFESPAVANFLGSCNVSSISYHWLCHRLRARNRSLL